MSWICPFNPAHVWEDRISNRTVLLRGCPICSKQFRVSYAARAVYYYLRSSGISCSCEEPAGRYTVDIMIPPLGKNTASTALEIDGCYTHSSPESAGREARKDAYLRQKGCRVIRAKESPLQSDGIAFENDVITYPFTGRNAYLDSIIRYLLQVIAGIHLQPDHVKDHWRIERLYCHDRKNRSVAVKYPALAKEWSEKIRIRRKPAWPPSDPMSRLTGTMKGTAR